jgi:hypothetical protein
MTHKEAELALILLGAARQPPSTYHSIYTLKNGNRVWLSIAKNHKSFIHYRENKNEDWMTYQEIVDQVRKDL